MLCGHAARIVERLLYLACEREFEHLGTGFLPVADRGAEGFDEGALIRGLGDARQAADRLKGGGGNPAVGLDMRLGRFAVVGAEDDVLFADGGAIELLSA
jgi:hypothetical protein